MYPDPWASTQFTPRRKNEKWAMKMPSRFFPLFFWPASLQTIISPSLIVSCHGEHVDVKVFILSLSSLRILLLMIFHTLRANRSMERGPSGWRTSDESGKGAAELDCRRNPLSFLFLFLYPPSCLFLFFWGMEPGEPITARYSPLGPSLAPVWHFLNGAWVVIVLCIQHQEERNTAKIFPRPTRRNDTKLDSGAINSSTGSKLWSESE